MEHITSKEFGENIDHEDKSYVLCPARWFEGLS